jgi:acyl-coenzyme A synthetase/AMP-(fatty) acid ligase
MSFFNLGEYLVDRLVDLGYGDRVAIISSDSGEVTRYTQLQQEVCKMVSAFQRMGLRREERIGLILRDRKEFVISFLASAKLGCVVLPMNPAVAVHTTCLTLKEALCRVIISEAEFSQELVSEFTDGEKFIFVGGSDSGSAVLPTGMRGDEDKGVFTWTELQTKSEPSTFCCRTIGDSPCYWACTSGTTGLPKIAMHRHTDLKILSEQYAGEVLLMNIERQDISFSAAPIFHTYGQGNAMFALSYGATIVLEEHRPISPKRIAHIVRTYRPTLFYSVPTAFNALVQIEEPADTFASIRIAVSAGEPLPDTIFDSFRKVYGVDIIDGIGSTEAGHIYCSNRMDNLTRNSCGYAIPGYELQLRDDVGKVVPSVKGAIGTLYVKSPSAGNFHCLPCIDFPSLIFVCSQQQSGTTVKSTSRVQHSKANG